MNILLPSGWVLAYDAILLTLLYLTRSSVRSPLVPVDWLWGVLVLAGGIIQWTDGQLAQRPDGWLEAGLSVGAVIVPIYAAWRLGQRSALGLPRSAAGLLGNNPLADNPLANNPLANNPLANNPLANNPLVEHPSGPHDPMPPGQTEPRSLPNGAQLLAEMVPVSIFMYRGLQLVYANQAAAEMTGYSRDELVGMSIGQLVHPDFRAVAEERAIARQHQETLPSRYELKIVTKAGGERWIDFSGSVVSLEGKITALGTAIDVTARKRLELHMQTANATLGQQVTDRTAELERSLSLLRATLEATEDGILAIDLGGKITVCNHRFQELYNVTSMIAPLDDRELLPMLCAQVKEPESFRRQVEQEYLQPTIEHHGMLEFHDGRVYERHSNPQYIGDQVVGRVINYRDITRSRQAEAALRRSESKNRALLQTIPDLMIHMNRDGFYIDLFVAKNFQTIRPEGDLRGLHIADVIPPDIAAQRLYYVHQALETGEMQCYEYLLEVNGISQYEEARIAVIDDDEVLVIVRDISDRHRMMQELTYSEATKRALLETIPDLIHRMKRDGTYLDFFPASSFKMLMPFDTLQGRNVFEILPPVLATERMQYVERAIQTGTTQCYDYEVEIDGVTQYEEARISVINNDELLVIVRDISDRKQTEAALREARDYLELRVQERTQELSNVNASLQSEIAERLAAQRRLEQLTLDLQRSNQELEQFAYVASHDLQEPLRTITSYTQLLAKRYQGQLDDRADRYVHFIVDGATRMQQLIRDLLTYSKVGRRELKCQPTDCNVILQRVMQDLQRAIAESGCTIHYPTLPTVMAEASQLSLLFQNLIGNAIKYRRDVAPTVEISAIQGDRHWLFRIQDNGIGIEPQYRDRIFEIFQRLHTSDEYSGTGLGLAICKKIVERHGGQIGVESDYGQGSVFYFTIAAL